MEKVVIQRCAGYGVSLEENIRTAFSCCFGRMQDAVRPGDKVLLKPNLLLRNVDGITFPSRRIDLGQICSISNHKS
jgi:uncharacterized protein (DUF362 family)